MEDYVWRTVGGRRIKIKNGQSLEDAMKKSGKFKLKKVSQGPVENKKEERAKEENYTYLEDDRGELNGDHYYSMYAINKETKFTEGTLDYKQNADGQYEVERINVMEQYRRKGVATSLYQRLQEKAGDKEIKFGILTDDGKKLFDKVVETTRVEETEKGVKIYYGKVKK